MSRLLDIVEGLDVPEAEDELSPLDSVLQEADELREHLCSNLNDFGLKEAELCSGGVEQKAYWSWSFIIESDDQFLECAIILYLDAEDNSRYSVEVVSSSGRAWATANTAEASNAASTAFEELRRLFGLIAQENV